MRCIRDASGRWKLACSQIGVTGTVDADAADAALRVLVTCDALAYLAILADVAGELGFAFEIVRTGAGGVVGG